MEQWVLEEKAGIKFFKLSPLPQIVLIFITRFGNLLSDDLKNIKKALGITKIFTLKQIHSNRVFYINRNNFNQVLEGDGIFTDEKGLAIGVKVADCLPIYIFDKKSTIIGIGHSGWRSTLAQIGKNLVSGIEQKFGINPTDLNFVLGPCIEQSCYEVGFEVLAQFFNLLPGSEKFFIMRNRKIYFDLKGFNRYQLKQLGLTEIASLDYCSKCNPDLFYSVRRADGPGRNLTLIYLLPK
jgi:YfiH family protein|uniref:Purine nucleoside phosphorylase n=1 Tax=candidate division WOR-3 bacterium TaxID=2052148 RepID=A0A7C6AAD7_UNCW3